MFRNNIRCGGQIFYLISIVHDDAHYKSETKIIKNILMIMLDIQSIELLREKKYVEVVKCLYCYDLE